jgi:cysteinyl-tRNA synthetase
VAVTATGKKFAALWLHAAHLLVDGKKMSKSAANEYTLDDLGARPRSGGKGYSPADFRYYCLTLHYSSPMNFTWDGQEAAARARIRLQAAFRRAALRGTSGGNVAVALRAEFLDAISDDLNMPRALAVAHKAVRSEIGGDVARSLAAEWDAVLAVGLLPEAGAGSEAAVVGEGEPEGVPDAVAALARQRGALRTAGDYEGADALRERIRAAGYDVSDHGMGPGRIRKL